jgi:hypothetical protein
MVGSCSVKCKKSTWVRVTGNHNLLLIIAVQKQTMAEFEAPKVNNVFVYSGHNIFFKNQIDHVFLLQQ